jgi:hypothetical protein
MDSAASQRSWWHGVKARPGTALLYVALAVCAAPSITLPFSRSLQSRAMSAHQLRPQSVPAWVVLQLWPKMYSFAHQVWISGEPVTDYLLTRGEPLPFQAEMTWVNHYPGHFIRFETSRRKLVDAGIEVHIYLRSSYRGLSASTRYVIHPGEDGLTVVRAP